jgi:hypothetical protein
MGARLWKDEDDDNVIPGDAVLVFDDWLIWLCIVFFAPAPPTLVYAFWAL